MDSLYWHYSNKLINILPKSANSEGLIKAHYILILCKTEHWFEMSFPLMLSLSHYRAPVADAYFKNILVDSCKLNETVYPRKVYSMCNENNIQRSKQKSDNTTKN